MSLCIDMFVFVLVLESERFCKLGVFYLCWVVLLVGCCGCLYYFFFGN